MGSTGSGRFSDYPGTSTQNDDKDGTNLSGGQSGVDRCVQAFNVVLEEVGNCTYYTQYKNVPSQQVQLTIVFDNGRLFAIDSSGMKVGALPTSFNYLLDCINSGYDYIGLVTFSRLSPMPTVSCDFMVKIK